MLGNRRLRNFQGNFGCIGQKSTGNQQNPSLTDIQSGTELQKPFPLLIHTSDKDWDWNCQSLPLPLISAGNRMGHSCTPYSTAEDSSISRAKELWATDFSSCE